MREEGVSLAAGIPPAKMHAGKKQARPEDIEDYRVKRALVERGSSCPEQQERQGKAGDEQVFVRDARDGLHTSTSGGSGIFFLAC